MRGARYGYALAICVLCGAPAAVGLGFGANIDAAGGTGEWTFATAPAGRWEDSIAADLDGDQNPEVIAVTNRGFIHALDGRSGFPAWSTWLSSYVSSIRALDLNDDARVEIVAVGVDLDGHANSLGLLPRLGVIAVLEGTSGTLIARYAPSWLEGTVPRSIGLADLDGDGTADVVVAFSSDAPGRFNGVATLSGASLLAGSPEVLWTKETGGWQPNRHSLAVSPTAPQDGPRILLASFSVPHLLSIRGATGLTAWSADAGYASAYSADIDGDGTPEAVTIGGGTFVHDALTGEQKLGIREYGAGVRLDGDEAALADVDGDGDLEIITSASVWHDDDASWNTYLVALHGSDGAELWRERLGPGVDPPYRLIAADLQGDGTSEIVLITGCCLRIDPVIGGGTDGPRVEVRDGASGRLLALVPLQEPTYALDAADLDGDGRLEIIVGDGPFLRAVKVV